jgi:hypothetical protein
LVKLCDFFFARPENSPIIYRLIGSGLVRLKTLFAILLFKACDGSPRPVTVLEEGEESSDADADADADELNNWE